MGEIVVHGLMDAVRALFPRVGQCKTIITKVHCSSHIVQYGVIEEASVSRRTIPTLRETIDMSKETSVRRGGIEVINTFSKFTHTKKRPDAMFQRKKPNARFIEPIREHLTEVHTVKRVLTQIRRVMKIITGQSEYRPPAAARNCRAGNRPPRKKPEDCTQRCK